MVSRFGSCRRAAFAILRDSPSQGTHLEDWRMPALPDDQLNSGAIEAVTLATPPPHNHGAAAPNSLRGGAGEIDVDLAQAVRHRTRPAIGNGLAVDGHHRLHEHGRAGDEGLLCRQRLLDRKWPFLDAKLALLGKRNHRLARAARQ